MRPNLLCLLLLTGCLGTDPHRPEEGRTRPPRPEPEEPRRAPPAEDPWSLESALPRSGDPARPNVKVEVGVVDVVTTRALAIRAGVRGSLVRGVLDLRASLQGGGGETRVRSRSSSFIVVQAGHTGSIQLTEEACGLCGIRQGLWVDVREAGPDGARLAIALAAPGAAGDQVSAASEVLVRPGEALVLGGHDESREAESRGIGRHAEASQRRQLLVLLTVDVIG